MAQENICPLADLKHFLDAVIIKKLYNHLLCAKMNIEHPKRDKSRIGCLTNIYFYICEQEYSRVIHLNTNIKIEACEYEQFILSQEKMNCGIKSIVFAALCVEAAINDYAGWQLGDNYFETHLENLNVLSKWVIIPKLICGKSINKGGPAYAALKKLISSRNELVHNKSKNLDFSHPDLPQKIEKNIIKFSNDVENSYKSLVLLSLEMEALVGPGYSPLITYDKELNPLLEIPENLVPIVDRCKVVMRKNGT